MYELHLSYNTSLPAHRRDAYMVSIVLVDDAPYDLRQHGPVWNGIVHYRGVFTTHAAACKAFRDYMNA